MTATILDFPSMQRGRRAFAEAIANGSSALDASLAQIRATFDEAAVKESFKARVRFAFKQGTGHPTFRARYGACALQLCGRTLDEATFLIEKAYCLEPPGLSRLVLQEIRLMLRFGRRYGYAPHFPAICLLVIGEALEIDGVA
jgi:hypothetical protein